MKLITEIQALDDAIDYFQRMPELSARSARLAINTVTNRGALRLARERISEEAAFPQGYLNADRLRVTKLAKESDLEAIIVGRKRATSLARFAEGQSLNSKYGVRVRVKSGRSVHLRKAWLVRLRKGASITEDNYNVGLALRIRPGERLVGKSSTHQSWLVPGKVALLYGPSVDQIFRAIVPDIAPIIADMVTDEFFRQFQRLA